MVAVRVRLECAGIILFGSNRQSTASPTLDNDPLPWVVLLWSNSEAAVVRVRLERARVVLLGSNSFNLSDDENAVARVHIM